MRDLVEKHRQRPQAFAQTVSTPFKRAYPALNDFIGLYDSRVNKHNPAVRAYKDEIAKRITDFYRMREDRKNTKFSYPSDTLKVDAPSPHKQQREVSTRGPSARELAKTINSGDRHDDA